MRIDLKKEIAKFMKELVKKADKSDLKTVESRLSTDLKIVESRLSTDLKIVESRLSADINWLKENMFTRDDFMQYMVLFDEMATEVKEARREQLLFASRFVDLDDTVNNHEQRIKVLETS
ncbi:MAG: hypothetical protein GWP15_03420 [Nitrospirae bacterium]|nr:hypothetical protein [Nitrospirota bacterium]